MRNAAAKTARCAGTSACIAHCHDAVLTAHCHHSADCAAIRSPTDDTGSAGEQCGVAAGGMGRSPRMAG